ncbi:hypothetical protein [Promicromonospora aerolata]|uniref:Uncharacterized protein n=1 Tax=Promicromonospora aerolata TaxID=195749 RepID=A0ABW4V1F8_9MICO
MSVLYRALWSDKKAPQADPVDYASRLFARWALSDESAVALPAGEHVTDYVAVDWRATGSVQRHLTRTVTVRPYEDAGSTGVSLTSRDVPDLDDAEQTVWTTTVRVVRDDEAVHTWVETLMETADLTRRYKVGRPRIVESLLTTAGAPMLESSKLSPEALDFPSDGVEMLVDHLQDPHRTLPVIVFTEPWTRDDDQWRSRADQVAKRAAGVARVIRLDAESASALRKKLGPLGIWGGAVRTYQPGPVDRASDGWRHRYLSHDRLTTDGSGVVDRLVYTVAQLSTRRRVPAVLSALAAQTTDTTSTSSLKTERDNLEWELELALDDQETLTRELAQANGHLERLRQVLADKHLDELFWASRDERPEPDELPDEVPDTTGAVLLAQEHLGQWLSVPDTAAQELDGIDSAPTAFTWANNTWRGLRALAAYAQAKQEGWTGSFWEWCAGSGNPFVWPATTKKLAMNESETVQNNTKLYNARIFAVDTALAADGKQYMGAHLKISEGGGNLAPRVYFHDDTGGVTGKIHVGFVGPHYLVPNTRS